MKNLTATLLYELEHDNSPAPQVTIIGDLNYDYIYRTPPLESGKEVLISSVTKEIAGAGGYVACGLAKLGASVYLLTELGDDDDGHSLYREIAGCGVRREGILIRKGMKSPFTLIFSEEEEDTPRQVATYLGTLSELSIGSLDYKKYVARSDLVYSCNYFIIPGLREEIEYVFQFAGKKNVLTAYDANAGDGWEEKKRLTVLRNRIYPLTDIIFLNEAEAHYLNGGKDPLGALSRLIPESSTVVIKLGARGLMLRHRGRIYQFAAFPIDKKVRDTIGAGDSFQAAFLFFYLKKFPIELCAVLGAANAASTVQHKGGTPGQLDFESLIPFVKRYKITDRGNGEISISAQ